jgi:RNA polymerase sigma-70 factor (ECF subfamily)
MNPSPNTSLSLLDRLRGSDESAWGQMAGAYVPLMRAWLRPRGLQDADIDDLTQKTLAVVARKVGDYRHNGRTGAFRAWLRAIVVNVLRDHRRADGRDAGIGDALLAELEDPASELNQRWDAEHDRHVLAALMDSVRGEFTPSTWAAFVRTALGDESPAAVAAELGLSVNAVRVARSRVLARLRREAGEILGGV